MEEITFKIERIIEEYIITNGIVIDDLRLFKKINDIVLFNCNFKYNLKYRKYYSFNQIDNIVCKFLKQFNYDNYYQLRKKDKTIYFDNESYNIPYSYYDFTNQQRKIYIPITNTLEDVYSIVHELAHDLNIDDLGISEARSIFTESISLLFELLLEDYLKTYKYKDYKIANNLNLYNINIKSLYIDFNIKLISVYLKKFNINYQDIQTIILDYNNYQRRNLNNIVNNILIDNCIDIDFEFRYILGIVIATYLYYRIKKSNSYKELYEMNDIIINNNVDQVFEYLNLNCNDINNNTYKVLTSNYIKYVKSR